MFQDPKNKKTLIKYNLLGLNISTGPYQAFVDNIALLALSAPSSYVCIANVHMLIEAHKDPAFAAVVNNADIVTPDGMPLAKGLKLLYQVNQDRVAGMDLLPHVLSLAEQKAIAVYFYGSTKETLTLVDAYCRKHFPGLKIAGLHSPPFRPLTTHEEEETIRNINLSGAKIVLVALGCPKQEKWMASMKNRINACMLGVGGALPVMAGLQKRAPLWIQKISMEWFYRLLQEPRRLFKRYAITNSIFLMLFFKELVKHKRKKALA